MQMRHPLTVLALLSLAGPAAAGESLEGGMDRLERESESGAAYQFSNDRHELDGYTRLTGWQISQTWYFGKQRGADSGLGFVWQRDDDQMSLSTEGLRFTRRF